MSSHTKVDILIHFAPYDGDSLSLSNHRTPADLRRQLDPTLLYTKTYSISKDDIPGSIWRPSNVFDKGYTHPNGRTGEDSLVVPSTLSWEEAEVKYIESDNPVPWVEKIFGPGCKAVYYLGED
ncbi:hypothetical protein SNOG_09485 [Parastagonospora nodorum SN15]|uniref:Uncharacterized protein n=1 Tax=Phaeosphaeria nodorum (strain SN15 / ATCC MYA-4574 / FGSC 10173) TaxID=321614 RepID=Q0UFH9_PHANO|nr:hypothetical protein SNOG_09485 [Parastagonospora nodorum SN15]EAT82750.1 hypothetical protein SNOG_09485 [Parastagonospora nodorum SN15]